MAKIIVIVNQKGGVGKTTTAINLSASLAIAEKRVLLIDMDPQGNSTSGLGVDAESVNNANIYHALVGNMDIKDCVSKTDLEKLQVIPANQDLGGAEVEMVSFEKREYVLQRHLKDLAPYYDYIFIDCPPTLGLLTINALTASDSYIVPLQCEYFALEGLSHILKVIELIKQNLNPHLQAEGILLTMFDKRNNLSHQVAQEVLNHFGKSVFRTMIPRNVRLSESPSFGKPILLYDMNSIGAKSYLSLAEEIIKKNPTIGVGAKSGKKINKKIESFHLSQ